MTILCEIRFRLLSCRAYYNRALDLGRVQPEIYHPAADRPGASQPSKELRQSKVGPVSLCDIPMAGPDFPRVHLQFNLFLSFFAAHHPSLTLPRNAEEDKRSWRPSVDAEKG